MLIVHPIATNPEGMQMTKTEASKSAAKLNKEQRTALECLKRNGHHAGQWVIGGSVRTRRVLRELVQLGLAVERQERNILGPYVAFYPVRGAAA